MRKKRFMAFLLSLAMAGTSVYTCGVIDVQAAAVENENPNAMEQLADEIQAQSADPTDTTGEEPVVEQQEVNEPQAEAGSNVEVGVVSDDSTTSAIGDKVEWGKTVKITSNSTNACFEISKGTDKRTVAGDTYAITSADVGSTITASANADTAKVFDVTRKTITPAFIQGLSSVVYSGEPQKPSFTVSDPNGEEITDFGTATWGDNTVDVGDLSLTITIPDSNPLYMGTATRTVQITQKPLTTVKVETDAGEYPFVGAGETVKVTGVDVYDGNKKLESDDYTITWTDAENIYGTPSANVVLRRNYSGSVTVPAPFKVVPMPQGTFDVTLGGRTGTDFNFNQGTTLGQVKAQAAVKCNGYAVSAGDYEITCSPQIADSAALDPTQEYTLTFSGKGNYGPGVKKECKVKIAAQGISADDIQVALSGATGLTYNGAAHTPGVTVSVNALSANGTKHLEAPAAGGYSVSYSDNVNAGTAKVIVTVTDKKFTEVPVSQTVSFNIAKASLTGDIESYSVTKRPVYNGGPQAPKAEDILISANFSVNGKKYELKPGVDYTVSEGSYAVGHTNADERDSAYTCKISANGNFEGEKEIQYGIDKVDISTNAAVKWPINSSYPYTGQKIEPPVVVTYDNLVSTNKNLRKDTDYTVTYGDNNKPKLGGTVTVTGTGDNYKGSQTKRFAIGDPEITHAVGASVKYTGKPVSVSDLETLVTVYSSSFEIDNADYELEYADGKNPTDVGEYEVKVKGLPPYGGQTTTATLRIVPGDFVSTNKLVSVNVGPGYSFKSTDPNEFEKPEIKVSYNGIVLKEGTDYTTTFTEKRTGGTVSQWVDIKAASKNLEGTISKSFEILPSDFSNEKLELEAVIAKPYVYDGNAKTPSANDIELRDVTHNVVLSSGDYRIKSYAQNRNAGTAYVEIEAVAVQYTGSRNVPFTIEPRDISDDTVKLSTNELKTVSGATYDISEHSFGPTEENEIGKCISYNNVYLENGKDYTIEFRQDGKKVIRYKDAGIYDVFAIAKGNFKGEREIAKFKVEPAAIVSTDFRLDPSEATYTGKAFKLDSDVKVVPKNNTYRSNEYKASAPEMLNKGTYNVTVSGQGNYTGEFELPFTIRGVQMTKDNTNVTFSGISENGQVMVDVRTEGRRLERGVDYTYEAVSKNDADPKAWDVTIYPAGNYEGGVTQEVKFGKIVLENEDIEVLADFNYNGQEQQLTKDQIRVTKGGKALSENTDYTVSNPKPATKAGDVTTLSINGINDYTGVATAEAEIKAISLTSGAASVVKNPVYTGSPVGPEVEVSVNGVVLTPDVDYVVEVKEDAIEIGKGYTATIRGIGNYGDTLEVTYDILKPTLENATIVEEKLPYTGKPQVPTSIRVVLGDKVVAPDQYDITYENENSTEVGTYNLTITGKGNYEGTKTGTYQIVGVTLEDAKVEVEPVVYTGAKADPKVTVTIGDTTLVEDTDYIVDAGNAINVKKDNTLTIVGIGNYSGEIKATFEIKPATITTSNVKVTIPAVTYNGKAQTPANATVIVGSRALSTKDFTLAVAKGANNTNAGKVKVTVTGKGNYTGTVTGEWFTINRKSISRGKVSGIKDKTYTGKAIVQGVIVTLDGKQLKKSNGCISVTYKNNKNIGPASLTITGKGNYTGTLSGRTFRIFPKKATIKSLKAGSNRFTVQVKKLNGGVKYQIQYRVKGSKAGYTRVETKNLKKVIKGLRKGKTYTVKVRAYKKVGKRIYYGEFSKAKNVKIK